MAIRSGRVGVREDQVDVHGRIIATQHLIDQIKKALQEESNDLVEEPVAEPTVIDVTPKKTTRKKNTNGD